MNKQAKSKLILSMVLLSAVIFSTTYFLFVSAAPTTTISGIAISADTGSSNSDFITKTAAQTITATLSSGLGAGEILNGSTDSGITWNDISSKVSGTAVSWDGITLTAGTHAIQMEVTNTTDSSNGPVASQTYTLDSTAPTTSNSETGGWHNSAYAVTLSPSDPAGSGVSYTNYSLDVAANLTGTSVSISTNGNHSIAYYSVDVAGNVEALKIVYAALDTVAPSINSAITSDSDAFYSVYDKYVNVSVNASDISSGVSLVVANFSNISSTICANGDGTVNLTLSSGIYKGVCDISSAIGSVTNPEPRSIIVTAFDSASPVSNHSSSGMGILVQNMGVPPQPGNPCVRFGNQTTNFTTVPNFAAVNFTIQMEQNGSCLHGPHGGSSPWEGFQQVMMMNFSSLNMSDQSIGQRLAGLKDALQVNVTPPHMDGPTRIYLNETLFAELNTNATITLNNLPFSSLPTITADNASRNATSVQFIPGTPFHFIVGGTQHIFVPKGDLIFSVVGFSGYTPADVANPLITINSPLTNLSNGTNVLVNVTVNGTGSDFRLIQISLNSSLSYDYNGSNPFGQNTANCTNISADMETFGCLILANLSEGSYNLNVSALDFGNNTGNTNTSSLVFKVDTTAPAINLSSIATSVANGSAYSPSAVYQFNVTASDGSGVGIHKVIMTFNGINYTMSSAGGVYTNSSVPILAVGEYNYSFWANDTLGNSAGSAVQSYTIVPAASTLTLYINGSSSGLNLLFNTTTNTTSNISLNVSLSNSVGLVNLSKNGTLIYRGVTPYAGNTTNFTSAGVYTIYAYFDGNANYSAATSVSYNINVNPESPPSNGSTSPIENGSSVPIPTNTTGMTIGVYTNSTGFADFSADLNGTSVYSEGTVDLTGSSGGSVNYTAEITPGTTITGPSGWDGKVALPTVNSSTFAITTTGYTNVVNLNIQMGDVALNFSNPVKLVLELMTGKKAAWSSGSSTLTAITLQCTSATDASNIVGNGECYFDDGTDLIIWTKHFTLFSAYTSTAVVATTSPGSSGGGCLLKWTCGEWSACADGNQTRTCTESGCGFKPKTETQSCTASAAAGTGSQNTLGQEAQKVAQEVKQEVKKAVNDSWKMWMIGIIVLLAVLIGYMAFSKKK